MKNTQALKGNLYCFLAYFIFGFNIIFCKNIAADGTVSPIVMFLLRSGGALILFLLLLNFFLNLLIFLLMCLNLLIFCYLKLLNFFYFFLIYNIDIIKRIFSLIK